MRSALLGVLGLVLGALGAFGYSHYLGEGKQLADLQDQWSALTAKLAKTADENKQAKSETDALSAQVEQLSASNEKLKQQIASAAPAPASTATSPMNPFGANMGGMMKEILANKSTARLELLKTRLHLTDEQVALVKAAMDEQDKNAQEMTAKMFSGGKIDAQAVAAQLKGQKTVDQTLDDILNPQQKTDYEQMKTDEKNSAAETMASVEMNQFAPALQLSETQKDQVYNALAQAQLNTQDPNWIKNNLPSGGNPTAMLDVQAKAKEDALAKILTPDQLAIYHQQAQSQLDMQKSMMQKFMPQAAAAGAVVAPDASTAPAAPPAPSQ